VQLLQTAAIRRSGTGAWQLSSSPRSSSRRKIYGRSGARLHSHMVSRHPPLQQQQLIVAVAAGSGNQWRRNRRTAICSCLRPLQSGQTLGKLACSFCAGLCASNGRCKQQQQLIDARTGGQCSWRPSCKQGTRLWLLQLHALACQCQMVCARQQQPYGCLGCMRWPVRVKPLRNSSSS
jgi:hypothetical protein